MVNKKLILSTAIIFLMCLFFVNTISAAWWDSNYAYKRTVSNLTGTIIRVNITYNSHMQSDFDDIRFVNSAENKLLNFTLESKTNSNYAIYRVQTNSESSIYMYYGYASATSNVSMNRVYYTPLHYYYLDGNANDVKGTNNGSISGATSVNYGRVGKAYSFDGNNDLINLGDLNLNTYSGLTYSVWVNATKTPESGIIGQDNPQIAALLRFNNLNMFDLRVDSDGAWAGGVNATDPTPVTIKKWYHLVATWDGSNLRVYTNGVLKITKSYSSTFYDAPITYIGRYYSAAYNFSGLIDEVGIWNKALSSSEILALNGSRQGFPVFGSETAQVGVSIDYITPPTRTTGSKWNYNYIPIKVNVSYLNVTFSNITYRGYRNGVLNKTTFLTSQTYNVNLTNCLDGTWTYNVTACGLSQYDGTTKCSSTTSRTLLIDTTNPVISITSPPVLFNFLKTGLTLHLNFTASDAHLGSCWWNYNGVNHSIACGNGTVTHTTFPQAGVFNITVYANDTYGNVAKLTRKWGYQLFESQRVYNANAVQTGVEQFTLSMYRNSSITSISSMLHYGGSSYSTTRTIVGNNVNFTSSIDIPGSLLGNTSFYWTIYFTNSTGTYAINTSLSYQVIYNLTLVACSKPALTGLTLNFTTYDSTNMTKLNSTLEATFQFYAASGSGTALVEYLFSDLNENKSNYMYCLSSGGQNVTLNAFISYGATGHDSREYIISDGIIGNFTQNIPLFLTLTSLTDIVTIKVQDQNYNAIAGALVTIQKWNIGTNTYSTIGMFTTSSTGQGLIDLELYTTWYRAVVTSDGTILEVTDVQKLSDTSWVITIETIVENPYDLFGNIAHGLVFDNSTNITTFTWVDSSGYVNRGCMVVYNQTNLGKILLYSSCISSVSGTIDYLLPGDGEYLIYGIVYLTGYNKTQITDVLSIRLGEEELMEKVSPFGKVISFIAVGTAGAIGVSSGSVVFGMFLVIIVLIALMKVGFLNITWGFVWGIIVIGLLIIFAQRRKK